MSAESADVVREYFADFETGDVDSAAQFWHPDIEWHTLEGASHEGGHIRGRDAMRRHYEDWVDTLEDLRAEVEEILFEDRERVAVVVRNSGRGRASGVPAEGRYYLVCVVRDGQIAVGREYATREEALGAVRQLG
jgi:ketosteroid isomerase-like protein